MAAVHLLLTAVCVLCVTSQDAGSGQELVVELEVFDDARPTTFVGTIPEKAGLAGVFNSSVLPTIRYYFLGDEPDNKFFTLDKVTGVMRTNVTIDRDELCPRRPRCAIEVKLAARDDDVRFFRRIKVTVTVQDSNDQMPSWSQGQIRVSLPENAPVNQTLRLSTAEDTDSPRYGVARYALQQSDGTFGLRVQRSAVDNTLQVLLVLQRPVDRERRATYRLTLVAYDGGVPANSGQVLVQVSITDVNDHKPVFLSRHYDVLVRETHALSQPIVRVEARDKDEGVNGQVVYSLAERTQRELGAIFRINSTSGEIYVTRQLDYQRSPVYTLAVTARDRSVGGLESEVGVTVRLLDVNNHAPEAKVSAFTPSGRLAVKESTAPNSIVAFIRVKDKDTGAGGRFSCSLTSGFFKLQRLSTSEYNLLTTAALDREARDSYTLQLHCRDQGDPPLNSTKLFTLAVADENDNTPWFTQQAYSAVLRENNRPGAFITRVHATDADSGDNGRITYRLHGNKDALFSIDGQTGNITARTRLDYERWQAIQLTVTAEDHGTPQARTATASVVLKLIDVNDEPPRFTSPSYRFTVYENEAAGAEVGQVSAVDRDTLPFSSFIYAFDNSLNPTGLFKLNATTGRLTTLRPLDRERQPAYKVVVKATDAQLGSLSSSATVSVIVGDRNDESPRWGFPNRYNNTVHMHPGLPAGFLLAKVSARDADVGPNARLTYLLRGGGEGFFSLHEDSGVLSLTQQMQDSQDRVFHLLLVVKDAGEPSRSAETMLNVIVNRSLVDAHIPKEPLMSNQNMAIVISVTIVTAVLIVVLVIAIVFIRRGEARRRRQKTMSNLLRVDSQLDRTDKIGRASCRERVYAPV